MKYLLMIVLLFSFNQAAALSFRSGNQLLEECEAYLSETGSAASGNTCFGFVTGIVDAHDNFTSWEVMLTLWCPPDKMSTTQLIRIVTKHLQEHPESLHETAAGEVVVALVAAFPCE